MPLVSRCCRVTSTVVTGRGVSHVGYQTAEAMVVRKGFSVEQLRECLEEYADLNVVQVRLARVLRDSALCLELAVVASFMLPHPTLSPCHAVVIAELSFFSPGYFSLPAPCPQLSTGISSSQVTPFCVYWTHNLPYPQLGTA